VAQLQLCVAVRISSVARMIATYLRLAGTAAAVALAGLLAGCATGAVSDRGYAGPVQTKLTACFSYGCRAEKSFPITQGVSDRFAAIMADGAPSPEAERAALSKAIQYYEELSASAIGYRDGPKSPVVATGAKGQMDCIDESTNTRHVMMYLQDRGLMTHHAVQASVTRGALVDGRYPHWSAVIKDKASGKRWAVDSWYEPAGGPPDIVDLAYWRTRGIWGER
jgi:hypothetical protein